MNDGPKVIELLTCCDCRYLRTLPLEPNHRAAACTHPDVVKVTGPQYAFKVYGGEELVPWVSLASEGKYPLPSPCCPFTKEPK